MAQVGRPAHYKGPLGAWLKRLGLSQQQFADIYEAHHGVRPTQQRISAWARGCKPGRTFRMLLEKATSGGVPAKAWDRFGAVK
jgi:hypothetical protein